MFGEIVLFTGNSNPEFAKAVCKHMHQPLSPARVGNAFSRSSVLAFTSSVAASKVVTSLDPCVSVHGSHSAGSSTSDGRRSRSSAARA